VDRWGYIDDDQRDPRDKLNDKKERKMIGKPWEWFGKVLKVV
jgi:hypothetical protein